MYHAKHVDVFMQRCKNYCKEYDILYLLPILVNLWQSEYTLFLGAGWAWTVGRLIL
jgi:hypothetical protein